MVSTLKGSAKIHPDCAEPYSLKGISGISGIIGSTIPANYFEFSINFIDFVLQISFNRGIIKYEIRRFYG